MRWSGSCTAILASRQMHYGLLTLRSSNIPKSQFLRFLIEVAYLEEKGRVPVGTLMGIITLLDAADPSLVEVPVTRQIISTLLTIPRDQVPDMPDRVIAATALSLAAPLVSHDGQIRTSQVQTVW